MKLKRMQDWGSLKGEVVLLRTDFNVPIEAGIIQDETRIRAVIPTIQWLQKAGARILVLSHLGRPEGKDKAFTLEPIAVSLERELKHPVQFVKDCVGEPVKEAIEKMAEGDVALLENVRFYKEEFENDRAFAKQLVQFADVYVNDAFAVSHRNHTSVNAVAREIESAAGSLLQTEVEELSYVKEGPAKPLVVVIGGVKVKTKIGVIKTMLRKADTVIIGGALANTVLAADGHNMGASFVEEEMFSIAKSIVHAKNLILPTDVVLEAGGSSEVGALKKEDNAIDIGPETLELVRKHLQAAKTVVWNGPVGKFEDARGAHGTQEIARILGSLSAKTIIGGGETIQAVHEAKMENKIDFISTGGGAMLTFLEGVALPGLEPLIA